MAKYDAFISYSHAAERPVAIALQQALAQFAKPWFRLRALRIFRDDASLSANAGLWPSIETALDDSRYLLLLASPDSAESEWVQKEISCWLETKSPTNILIARTAGALHWSDEDKDFDWQQTDALPKVMSGVYSSEPRYLDLRWAREGGDLSLRNADFRDAIADLAAPLHGQPKDEMVGEDIVQHRRTIRIAWSAAVALLVLLIAAVFAGIQAINQRDEALRQRDIALSRQLAASAETVRADRLDLSLLLSLHALELADTPEARSALLKGLQTTADVELFLPAETNASKALFTADGEHLLVANPSAVDVIDPASGERLRTFGKYDCVGAIVNDVEVHPDGNLAAVGYEDGTIQMWDLRTGGRLGEPVVAHEVSNSPCADYEASLDTSVLWGPAINDLEFHEGGERLVAASKDSDVLVWTLDGHELSKLFGSRLPNLNAALTPLPTGGDYVDFLTEDYVLASGAGAIDVISTETNQYWDISQLYVDDEALINHRARLGVVNKGFFVLAVPGSESRSGLSGGLDEEGIVRIYRGNFENPPLRLGTGSEIPLSAAAVSAHDGYVIAGGDDGSLWAWDLNTEVLLFGPTKAHGDQVTGIELHPDGTRFVSTGADGSVLITNLETSRGSITPPDNLTAQNVSIDFRDDDARMVLGYAPTFDTDSSYVVVVEYPSLDELHRWTVEEAPLLTAEFDKNGPAVVTVTATGTVGFWDLNQSQKPMLARSFAVGHSVVDVAFSPDQALLASIDKDGRVTVWRTSDGAFVDAVRPDTGASTVALVDSSTLLLNDRRRWSLLSHSIPGLDASVDEVRDPHHFPASVGISDISVTPDRSIAAIGFGSGAVQLFNIVEWVPVRLATPERESRVKVSDFSGDGIIATVTGDLLNLWQTSTMRPVGSPFKFMNKRIANARFAGDGKTLAVALLGGQVRILDVDVSRWRERACSIVHRELTDTEWAEYADADVERGRACGNP